MGIGLEFMIGLIRVRESLENAINARGSVLVAQVVPHVDEALCVFEVLIRTQVNQEIVDRWPLLSINMRTQEMHRITEHGEQKESLGWLPFALEEEDSNVDDSALRRALGFVGRSG